MKILRGELLTCYLRKLTSKCTKAVVVTTVLLPTKFWFNQLIAEGMHRVKQSDSDGKEFLALSKEITETMKRIARR